MNLYGYEVIITNKLDKIVQARKHHKHRINKKWLKKYGIRCVSNNKIYLCDNKLIIDQKTYDKLKEGVIK